MSDGSKLRLPIWLIASLLANALLIGLLIGGGLGQKRAGPPVSGGGSEQALMRGLDEAVPSDQRRAVRQAFRRAFADTREERLRLRDARRDLGQLLTADPYDPDAVANGFKAMRAAEAAMKAAMHDVLAEQFGTLSAEQRQAIIRDFNRRSNRSRSGGRRGDGPIRDRRPKDRD
ncbi:MAG: periplasmic heavy metal sensor [Pseudomonadota bacterium]